MSKLDDILNKWDADIPNTRSSIDKLEENYRKHKKSIIDLFYFGICKSENVKKAQFIDGTYVNLSDLVKELKKL